MPAVTEEMWLIRCVSALPTIGMARCSNWWLQLGGTDFYKPMLVQGLVNPQEAAALTSAAESRVQASQVSSSDEAQVLSPSRFLSQA